MHMIFPPCPIRAIPFSFSISSIAKTKAKVKCYFLIL
nr:MAG TPA: hypothetical protein [Caudoviricetes sp.]